MLGGVNARRPLWMASHDAVKNEAKLSMRNRAPVLSYRFIGSRIPHVVTFAWRLLKSAVSLTGQSRRLVIGPRGSTLMANRRPTAFCTHQNCRARRGDKLVAAAERSPSTTALKGGAFTRISCRFNELQ